MPDERTMGDVQGAIDYLRTLPYLWPAGGHRRYRCRPARFITPYAPGGSTGIVARFLGQKLTERWGQQVIVDNRPGGNTIIGSEALVKSLPDGYTILLVSSGHAIIDKLSAELARILAMPESKEKLVSQGLEPFSTTATDV